jgi:adenosylhomocysteine nucleosidase
MKAVQAAFPPGVERRLGGLSVHVHSIGIGEYWLVQTGMGLEKARRSARQLLVQQSLDLVVSSGFACALVEADVGALLAGFEVVQRTGQRSEPTRSQPVAVPGNERNLALTFIQTLVPPERIGRFVSTDRVIDRAKEKRECARETEAIGLDMESAALAAEACRAQVPFVVIRSVSDLLDEDLPLDFNLFLRPTGWLKGIATVLMTPSSLLVLGRLRRQSLIAAQALTDFFRHYAAAMAAETQPRELSQGRDHDAS